MQNWSDKLSIFSDPRLLATIGVLVIGYLIRFLADFFLRRKVRDVRNRFIWRQSIHYSLAVFALLIVIRIWFVWFQSIVTGLSLIAAAITIISKELILNFLTHGVILWRGLFEVGDKIRVGDLTGEVLDIGPMYFTVGEMSKITDTYTGTTVKIPNMNILTQSVTNYSRGNVLVWHEIICELVPRSNWQKAVKICRNVVETHHFPYQSDKQRKLQSNPKELLLSESGPKVFLKVKPSGIQIIMRYMCNHYHRTTTESAIWQKLLEEFEKDSSILMTGEPAGQFNGNSGSGNNTNH